MYILPMKYSRYRSHDGDLRVFNSVKDRYPCKGKIEKNFGLVDLVRLHIDYYKEIVFFPYHYFPNFNCQ